MTTVRDQDLALKKRFGIGASFQDHVESPLFLLQKIRKNYNTQFTYPSLLTFH